MASTSPAHYLISLKNKSKNNRPAAKFTPFLIGCTFILASCNAPQIHHHRVTVFGTFVDIRIQHENEHLAQQAFRHLEQDFHTMHKVWHPWEAGPIKRVNQLLQLGEWFSAPTSVLPLLKEARRLSRLSQYYFNPTIGRLVELWGFHRHDPEQPFIPDSRLIKEIQRNIPTIEDIEFDNIRLRGRNRYLQFDPGGIAKGYAIDLSMQTLRAYGIRNALINAGGDLGVMGKKSDKPWNIGIRHPRSQKVLANLYSMADESIFTSGDYQRYYLDNGERVQHIIDPFNGRPVDHTIAATVIHSSAATADAAATALMAAGKSNWKKVTDAMDITYAMLLTREGELHMTAAMNDRITLQHAQDYRIYIH